MTPKQRNYLEKTELSAKNLLKILNDILDFSNIETGKLQMETVLFSLTDMIAAIHGSVAQEIQKKGLDFAVSAPPDLPHILLGDPLRLKQVLLHLISNAIKFTDTGKISVGIEKKFSNAHQVELEFFVKDTGIGMTPAHLETLFTPFSQADTSSTRKYGGTGLGLAICKSLVEMLTGEIRVESRFGAGSVFSFNAWFALPDCPAAQDEARHDPENAPERHQRAEQSPASENAWVLLVEDAAINPVIVEELLRNAGYMVDIADNGHEAIAMLEKKKYSLVLMDIHMPVLDGLAAARLLRATGNYTDLPIIGMSAQAMPGDREKSLDHGMNDHITKPLAPGVFYETLKKYL